MNMHRVLGQLLNSESTKIYMVLIKDIRSSQVMLFLSIEIQHNM